MTQQQDGIDMKAFEAHLNTLYPNKSTESLAPDPSLSSNPLKSPAPVPHAEARASSPQLQPGQSAGAAELLPVKSAGPPELQPVKIETAPEQPVERSLSAPAQSSAVLSHSVFASPQDFLKVLKTDFGQIAKFNHENLTRDNLTQYSQHGADAKGRLAAAIAVQHYDQLELMGPDSVKGYGISSKDLDDDLELATGDTGDMVAEKNLDRDMAVTIGGAFTAVLLKGVEASREAPPVAIGLGILALATGFATGCMVKQRLGVSSHIQKLALSEQQTIKTWLQ